MNLHEIYVAVMEHSVTEKMELVLALLYDLDVGEFSGIRTPAGDRDWSEAFDPIEHYLFTQVSDEAFHKRMRWIEKGDEE